MARKLVMRRKLPFWSCFLYPLDVYKTIYTVYDLDFKWLKQAHSYNGNHEISIGYCAF